jgi:hypothetical protein
VAAKCVINDQLVSANGPSAILSMSRYLYSLEELLRTVFHRRCTLAWSDHEGKSQEELRNGKVTLSLSFATLDQSSKVER